MKQNFGYETLIKIRIGEPLTALSVSSGGVCFGSISGYIGFYDLEKKETRYHPEVFDEIIRGIHLRADKVAYCAIGDYQGIKVDFSDEIPQTDLISYQDRRSHNSVICPSTIAYMYNNFSLLVTCLPTQNKDLDPSAARQNPIYFIDMEKKTIREFSNIEIPQHCVPFDFDGKRLLWLTYKEKGQRVLQIINILEEKTEYSFTLDKRTENLSFCKLFKSSIIFVENNKYVKCLDTMTSQIVTLYSHKDQIVALDLTTNAINTKSKFNEGEKEILIENSYQTSINVDDVSLFFITSIDYKGIVKVFKNSKEEYELNIMNVPNFNPQLKSQKLLFDMGYPYIVKNNEKHLCFTTDFGICIFNFL